MSLLPTTDLYFLNTCGHAVDGWLHRRAVRRLGPNCFATGDTILLIRRDHEKLMQDVERSASRLLYLIDDDVEAATQSASLPIGYRDRLIRFHEDHHRALTQRADTLIVTSMALRERFSWHPDVRLLHPVWHLPMANGDHFGDIQKGGLIRAVHLGSGSHADGHDFLRPIVETLLDRHEQFHFTYVSRQPAWGALDRHSRIRRIHPKAWPRYRRWIGKQRFHLGFYPLPNSPFNLARSCNKLLEHGAVGAVGVYSKAWPESEILTDQAIFAGESQTDWQHVLSSALTKPEGLKQLMLKARPTLDLLNDPSIQRRFWSELLDVAF